MSEETNALSRLARLNNDEMEKMTESISIDDYLEEDEDDIISKMKPAAQEPAAENPTISIDVTDTGDDSSAEELFNNNIVEEKPKRKGRPVKKVVEQTAPVVKETKSTTVVSNPLYDQLLKNMVNDLKKRKYKYDGFNDDSMNILFEYLESKI